MKYSRTLALVALWVLSGCSKQPEAVASSPFLPTASIQEIMNSQVDPAADFLWESVSTEVTSAGTVDHHPQNDAEWLQPRHAAIRLVESANLLVVEGRKVAGDGHRLEDAHVPGISPPEEIQQAIDADRSLFIGHAHELHTAASQMLAAIDAKNPEHLVEAGGK